MRGKEGLKRHASRAMFSGGQGLSDESTKERGKSGQKRGTEARNCVPSACGGLVKEVDLQVVIIFG